MQFKRFHWLSHHGISNYTVLFKYGKRTRFFVLVSFDFKRTTSFISMTINTVIQCCKSS